MILANCEEAEYDDSVQRPKGIGIVVSIMVNDLHSAQRSGLQSDVLALAWLINETQA